MLQADLLLWVSHLSQRSFLGYTSLTLVKPKLSEWSREMHSFIFFFKSSIRWKLPSVALLIERVTWEDDRWKTSESMSFYWTGILKNCHQWPHTATGPKTTWINLRTCGSHPSARSIQHSATLLSHQRQTVFWGFSGKTSRI